MKLKIPHPAECSLVLVSWYQPKSDRYWKHPVDLKRLPPAEILWAAEGDVLASLEDVSDYYP